MPVVLAQLVDEVFADGVRKRSVPGAVGGIIHLNGANALAVVNAVQGGQQQIADNLDAAVTLTNPQRNAVANALGIAAAEVPDQSLRGLVYSLLTASALPGRWARLRGEHDGRERIFLGGQQLYGPPQVGASVVAISDDFTGTNGDAWNARWTTSLVGAGSLNIQGNKGRQNTDTAGHSGARAYTAALTLTDCDALVSHLWSQATPAFHQHSLCMRASGAWSSNLENVPTAGYLVYKRYGDGSAGDRSYLLQKGNGAAGFGTTLVDISDMDMNTTKYWYRLRCSGSTIQCKRWADGGDEPVAWDATATDTEVASGYAVGLATMQTAGTSTAEYTDWDDLQVRDLTDTFAPDFRRFPIKALADRAKGY